MEFDQEIADPRKIEEEGRQLPVEEMTDNWVITTDPSDIRTAVKNAKDAGFEEVEIHSASPDQAGFVEMMAEEILPEFQD